MYIVYICILYKYNIHNKIRLQVTFRRIILWNLREKTYLCIKIKLHFGVYEKGRVSGVKAVYYGHRILLLFVIYLSTPPPVVVVVATHVVDTVIVLYTRVWAAVWRCRPDFTGARQRGGADQQSDPPPAAARRILSVRQTAESPHFCGAVTQPVGERAAVAVEN